MAKIYKEDVYCLGLLYSYRYANNSVVLKSDLNKFYQEIENNLKEMNIFFVKIISQMRNNLTIDNKLYKISIGDWNDKKRTIFV